MIYSLWGRHPRVLPGAAPSGVGQRAPGACGRAERGALPVSWCSGHGAVSQAAALGGVSCSEHRACFDAVPFACETFGV